MNPQAKIIIPLVIVIFVAAIGTRLFKTIPVGHVGVATLFGKAQSKTYGEGLHIPVNPLLNWTLFDARQKTHKETAQVPSQDQLQTTVDISVQYRIIGSQAPIILRDTGQFQDVIDVHLIPNVRSELREQGKSITRAEDFFLKETQEQLQTNMLTGLQTKLRAKGVEVDSVLIRQIDLPAFINNAIERKKEREQEAERQKAELERFRTEQQQKIAQAEAEREAAEQTALKQRVLADAQAYEIEKVAQAIAEQPAYIQLQALEALKAISADPAAKLYFLNGDSPTPLPLMHLGDDATKNPLTR